MQVSSYIPGKPLLMRKSLRPFVMNAQGRDLAVVQDYHNESHLQNESSN